MLKFKRLISVISAVCMIICIAGCSDNNDNEPENSTLPGTTASSTKETESKNPAGENESSSTSASKKTEGTTKTTAVKTTVTKAPDEYIYAYAGFNPIVTDMSAPITEILLNRYYRLPDGYEPKLAEAVKGSGVKLDHRVAPYYQAMYDAALNDGITLTPVSGYRSYARQKRNFENRIALYESKGYSKAEAAVKTSEVILLPGTSEHNAGLAMDICSLEVSFENTKEFAWLQAHAHEYGFIMRYPKDKTDITKITYEPWHYRYVGTEIAAELKSSGMVLEEYLSH